MTAHRIFPILVIILAACSLTSADTPPQEPTFAAAPTFFVQTTPVPTAERAFRVIETTPEMPTVQPTACPASGGLRAAQHRVTADVDYGLHRAEVEQTTRYDNHTSDRLQQLVLDVEPNRWPDAFTLESVTADGLSAL